MMRLNWELDLKKKILHQFTWSLFCGFERKVYDYFIERIMHGFLNKNVDSTMCGNSIKQLQMAPVTRIYVMETYVSRKPMPECHIMDPSLCTNLFT